MKVKMKTCQAGNDFVRNIGDIIDLPDAKAQRFIDAGIAELYVSPGVKSKSKSKSKEQEQEQEQAKK